MAAALPAALTCSMSSKSQAWRALCHSILPLPFSFCNCISLTMYWFCTAWFCQVGNRCLCTLLTLVFGTTPSRSKFLAEVTFFSLSDFKTPWFCYQGSYKFLLCSYICVVRVDVNNIQKSVEFMSLIYQ